MEKTTVRKKRDQIEQTRIDFKMVTFSLAGKDYGINIMKVKEISKASKFTFVPNAAPFVRGVYNLRGDIISVIDFRTFFNLPVPENENAAAENMIILRLENHTIAVIVDTIDKVVGIASENIQPPHPLFGDINIKYISGVVENDQKLYVILDTESIFGKEESSESKAISSLRSSASSELMPASESSIGTTARAVKEDVDIGFIEETLITFQSFYSSPVNQEWIRSRYAVWKNQRGENVQLAGESDAEAYLAAFNSPCTGMFWSDDYAEKIASFLNREQKGNFHVWNPGCGSGYESYSIACMIKKYLPSVHLRIIAHDNDLIRISTAPGLVADGHASGPLYSDFLMSVPRGKGFKKEIKDAILFEYHDITHDNTLPNLDMVVMRDTVSYLVPDRQLHIFSVLNEMMKSGGLLVLGAHEEPINPDAWEKVEKAGVVAYKKR
jgi:purine-binding chemotaxis protein CheW